MTIETPRIPGESGAEQDPFSFRLYVAGESENAREAIANLGSLCDRHLDGRCTVDVIDVFMEPERALADEVSMTPTLLKLTPGPSAHVVGTLGNAAEVMRALGLDADTGTGSIRSSGRSTHTAPSAIRSAATIATGNLHRPVNMLRT